ncbi:hypothetical protein PRIPAC_93927 [Pristionchus pacificus]|uniref:Uncharacterized protein n=1 Tax=Pristionchus pacificus TaxID=54126 RepID=A0A2A6CE78_PRIPA|nr:hypothetical protein PRIPAC_93927 [Pristionchus pacificus]|eukprot:PDM76417.1 hypothetical protein PRIPAC_40021 [Pristionchus pacificus]
MNGEEDHRRSPVCTGLIAMMMTGLMIGVVVVVTSATMRTQDHLKIYNLPYVREEEQDTKIIARDIGALFAKNDGGMFEELDGSDSVMVRYPEEPFEIDGLLVFFLEATPYFRQLPACKYFTAMNSGEHVEWCESIISIRCSIDIRHTGFTKTIIFPDGKRFYALLRITIYSAPVFLTLIAVRQFLRRNDPPPPAPRSSKAERLRMYRDDLDDLIRRCYQERR